MRSQQFLVWLIVLSIGVEAQAGLFDFLKPRRRRCCPPAARSCCQPAVAHSAVAPNQDAAPTPEPAKPKTAENKTAENQPAKPKPTVPAKSKSEWISLFNGKDLSGWKFNEDGKWRVEDGAIVANGARSHLFSEQSFKNFVFEADVMTTPGSNAGIYFHTQYQDEGWPSKGHEVQVNVSHHDPVKSGSLYNVVKVSETPAVDNEWYRTQITVKGRHVVVKVNGVTTVDYTEPEDIAGDRRISSGHFALQAHDPGSVVYFKNLRVRSLDD